MLPSHALPAIARPVYEATISFLFIHPEDGNCKNKVNTGKTSTPDMASHLKLKLYIMFQLWLKMYTIK
jgi:hypothetical protein